MNHRLSNSTTCSFFDPQNSRSSSISMSSHLKACIANMFLQIFITMHQDESLPAASDPMGKQITGNSPYEIPVVVCSHFHHWYTISITV